MNDTRPEAAAVSSLVLDAFSTFVAGDYEPGGIAEIEAYVRPDALLSRIRNECFLLVAEEKHRVVGMVEVEKLRHITLLFVNEKCHGRGIARSLITAAVRRCREHDTNAIVTVHASRYGANFYKRLGFVPTGPERTENGRIYLPMVLRQPLARNA